MHIDPASSLRTVRLLRRARQSETIDSTMTASTTTTTTPRSSAVAIIIAMAAMASSSCAVPTMAEPASAFVVVPVPPGAPFVSVAGGGGRRVSSSSVVLAAASTKDEATSTTTMKDDDDGTVVQEYRNGVTEILSNFMQKTDDDYDDSPSDGDGTITNNNNPLTSIDFDAPKFRRVDLDTLAEILDFELSEREWFVTGNVNPIYFADEFRFQDPDVKVDGIEDYARGVRKLFDQKTSRAEIISTSANPSVGPDVITVKWRLSGRVNIGPGLVIKPYVCYTDFKVDLSTGLIVFQEDRFDIPGYDILISAILPWLIPTPLLADPAPEVEPRVVPMPAALSGEGDRGGSSSSPLDKILSFFGGTGGSN
uniref:Uncharacterized protein n=1 Tax=Odontella aurita TaxID=265563 RepID=A0A7S4ITU2_9STRA|mmetsp:Transcript_30237/g.90019  ORF Transcript_30237/g.90019 Transcript_30237/m.90019 type:complete len:366 (+) Transcript_30237:93-1190(+)